MAKAALAATWTLAARGFVADAVDCLPHLVFVGPRKVPRGRAVRLVAASIEDLRVELTRARKRRGVIWIEDYEELSKEDAEIAHDLLLRPDEAYASPCAFRLRTVAFASLGAGACRQFGHSDRLVDRFHETDLL